MSFLNDLKMIEKDTQVRLYKTQDSVLGASYSTSIGILCSYIFHSKAKKMSSVSSPGRERWNLERKDSIHSLASEPNKIDTTTPFQRGALSVSSLNR